MLRPLMEELPYPDLKNLAPDFRTAKIIAPAYAASGGELTAVLQYVYHGLNFGYRKLDGYAELMESIAVVEMRHFDLLGEALIHLGANPIFTACPPVPRCFYTTESVNYTTVPAAMLLSDIAAETAAIEEYENMLPLLENERVAALIGRILLDEKLHLTRLKIAYKDFCKEERP